MKNPKEQDNQNTQEIAEIAPINILGIFEGYNFPQVDAGKWGNGQKPILSPSNIIDLETLYATTIMSMAQCAQQLTDHGHIMPITTKTTPITPNQAVLSWVQLMGKYEIVRSIHSHAKTLKADLLGGEALTLYTQDLELLPDELVTTSQDGSRQIASAGVAYIKGKHEALLKHARIMERVAHNKRQEERDTARVVNNNVTVNIKDLMSTPIEKLMQIDFTQG